MKNFSLWKEMRILASLSMVLLALLLLLGGCASQEGPLSKHAAQFKQEIKDCLNRCTQPLVEPLAQKDVKGMDAVLHQVEPETVKLCRMCPFTLAVMDKMGSTLTIFPQKKDAMGDFSQYQVVADTLTNRKINQQRLFLQNGAEIFVICAPILRGEEVLGVLAIALSATEAKQRWGITPQEFVALDFNQ